MNTLQDLYVHVPLISGSRTSCGDNQDGYFRLANISISTTDGSSLVSGRVEICHDGRYGSVCDLNWDNDDAQVACTNFFGRASDYIFGI